MVDCGTWTFNPGKPCCEEPMRCGVPMGPGGDPSVRLWSPTGYVVETDRFRSTFVRPVKFRYKPGLAHGYWRSDVIRVASDYVVRLDRDGRPVGIGPGITGYRIFCRGADVSSPFPGVVQVVWMDAYVGLKPTGGPWEAPGLVTQGFLDASSPYFDLADPVVDEDQDPFLFQPASSRFVPKDDAGGEVVWYGRSVSGPGGPPPPPQVGSILHVAAGTPIVLAANPPHPLAGTFSTPVVLHFESSECCQPYCRTCGCHLDYFAEIEDENGIWKLPRDVVGGSQEAGRLWGGGTKPSGYFGLETPDGPGPEISHSYVYRLVCCDDQAYVILHQGDPRSSNPYRQETLGPYHPAENQAWYRVARVAIHPGMNQVSFAFDKTLYVNALRLRDGRSVDPCTGIAPFDVERANASLGMNTYGPYPGEDFMPSSGGMLRLRAFEEKRRMVCCKFPVPRKDLVLSWTNPRIGDGSTTLVRSGPAEGVPASQSWEASILDVGLPLPPPWAEAGSPAGLIFSLNCTGLAFAAGPLGGPVFRSSGFVLPFETISVVYDYNIRDAGRLRCLVSLPFLAEWEVGPIEEATGYRPPGGVGAFPLDTLNFFRRCGFTSFTITE